MGNLAEFIKKNKFQSFWIIIASFLINLLALSGALYVIQVFNKYLNYKQDSTLIALTLGVLIALALEFFLRIIRNFLLNKTTNLNIKNNEHMSLSGVFRVLDGKIRSHVQPDYKDIKHEYYDPKQMKCVKDFLQFYEPVGPKLQCYSILWTGDPTGGELNLRESGEHTHFHSYEHDRDAGHYHFDVSPEEIEYEGYFNTATEVHRVNNIYKELLSKNSIE